MARLPGLTFHIEVAVSFCFLSGKVEWIYVFRHLSVTNTNRVLSSLSHHLSLSLHARRRLYLYQFLSMSVCIDDTARSMSMATRRRHKVMSSPTTYSGHYVLPRPSIHRWFASLLRQRTRRNAAVEAHLTPCISSMAVWLNCHAICGLSSNVPLTLHVPQHHSLSDSGLLLEEV